jgi:hypothetical protein
LADDVVPANSTPHHKSTPADLAVKPSSALQSINTSSRYSVNATFAVIVKLQVPDLALVEKTDPQLVLMRRR